MTVEGVEGTADINLTCPYPVPTVTITRTAQDTTIVLTQENRPVLILQETHTPTGGKFEPTISWEPSHVIDTRQYFEQFTDSLVLVVKAIARSIAGMEAVDSVRITLKKNVLDHFAVTLENDTIAFSESAKIFVQAKDANDADIDPPADTNVNIVLRADERYGNLVYQNRVGKEMIDVPYADARSGQVLFAATGENPVGLEPQRVQIGVTKVGQENIQGIDTVVVKCTIDPPRYAQGGDSPWADDHYDNAYDKDGNEIKIRTLGCALSCMAMAMTAFGDTVETGELNEWMKQRPYENGGYNGSRVNWEAITKHSAGRVSQTQAVDVDSSFNFLTLNRFLETCELLIVKVFNPNSVANKPAEVQEQAKRMGNHWVLIVGKTQGDYSILDPGRGLTLLSDYGRIYRYLRVFKK